MGGSLSKIYDIDKQEDIAKTDESHMKSLIAVKEVYEERIRDIKDSSAEQVRALKRDRKILAFTICALGAVLLAVLIFDLIFGNHGWIRY